MIDVRTIVSRVTCEIDNESRSTCDLRSHELVFSKPSAVRRTMDYNGMSTHGLRSAKRLKNLCGQCTIVWTVKVCLLMMHVASVPKACSRWIMKADLLTIYVHTHLRFQSGL